MTDSNTEVTVYTTSACPYCHAAKALLESKGVAFKEIDVTDNSELRESLVHMAQGRTTVPQIFKGNESIGGYEQLVAYYQSGKTL